MNKLKEYRCYWYGKYIPIKISRKGMELIRRKGKNIPSKTKSSDLIELIMQKLHNNYNPTKKDCLLILPYIYNILYIRKVLIESEGLCFERVYIKDDTIIVSRLSNNKLNNFKKYITNKKDDILY